jgi:hypothetical protein
MNFGSASGIELSLSLILYTEFCRIFLIAGCNAIMAGVMSPITAGLKRPLVPVPDGARRLTPFPVTWFNAFSLSCSPQGTKPICGRLAVGFDLFPSSQGIISHGGNNSWRSRA